MYSSNMRIDGHSKMDIDSWTWEMRAQSDIAKSYSSGGQPPSLGDVRQMMVSEPSGSNQMYSDGQPPSVNDVGRREPSQSEPSCTRYNYEGSDAHEVQQPSISDTGVEKNRIINEEQWKACAGPLVNLPVAGTHVVYFTQGHCEQVAASMKRDVDAQIPNFPNIPSQLFCMLHNVTLCADTETDEVYAQMTLQPVTSFDKEALLRSDMSMKAPKPQTKFFCKTLSDTSTHGGFLVPGQAAEDIFPPLDYSMQPPAQELVARDLHGNAWIFQHIYRGTPKRHLLTTGWSLLVSGKRLSPGDSVLFIRRISCAFVFLLFTILPPANLYFLTEWLIRVLWFSQDLRDEKQQLLLGIRRANRQPANPSSVLSSGSMLMGIVAAAALAVTNKSPFTVFYKPRYMGTITGICDLDAGRWKDSQWRNLKVGWDEGTDGERRNRVSVWEIEPVTAPFFISPTSPFYQSNDPTQWMLGNESAELDNINKRTFPWFGEDVSMKDPLLSLVQWMSMQKHNQIQPSYINPLAGSVLQNHAGLDLSLQLGLSAPQMLTQNNLQFINQRSTPQVEYMPAMMQP